EDPCFQADSLLLVRRVQEEDHLEARSSLRIIHGGDVDEHRHVARRVVAEERGDLVPVLRRDDGALVAVRARRLEDALPECALQTIEDDLAHGTLPPVLCPISVRGERSCGPTSSCFGFTPSCTTFSPTGSSAGFTTPGLRSPRVILSWR